MRIGGVEIIQYASGMMSSSSSAVEALNLKEASNWWSDVDESPVWQDCIFHVLAILYGIVSVVAVIQLVRIQFRVPEYGWTTQKVFHFLNFVVNGVLALQDLYKSLSNLEQLRGWSLDGSFLFWFFYSRPTTARVKAFGQPWKPASTSPQFEKFGC